MKLIESCILQSWDFFLQGIPINQQRSGNDRESRGNPRNDNEVMDVLVSKNNILPAW